MYLLTPSLAPFCPLSSKCDPFPRLTSRISPLLPLHSSIVSFSLLSLLLSPSTHNLTWKLWIIIMSNEIPAYRSLSNQNFSLTLLSHLISTEIMAHTSGFLEFILICVSVYLFWILPHPYHTQISLRTSTCFYFGLSHSLPGKVMVIYVLLFPNYTPCCPKNAFQFRVKKIDTMCIVGVQ